ncbi:MAG: dihydropteroate synthase [Bacteroidaceae bacterium]|nr:dihydropteroate synthase [Bacteroidaceae bacterium]
MPYIPLPSFPLLPLKEGTVMGILNATPDSFFSESRKTTSCEIQARALEIVNEGGDIIDIGACSTRPGSTPVSEDEELKRLLPAIAAVKEVLPRFPLSVDTFRANVARQCIETYGPMMVNDVSGGEDPDMFRTVAAHGLPYVLTSTQPTIREMMLYFAEKIQKLRDFGQKYIIIDPGFGFGKTLQDNYHILHNLSVLQEFQLPILIGLSRKSLIHRLLNIKPEDSLNGTTVLNTIALTQCSSVILRVHDVKQAKELLLLKESGVKGKLKGS